MGGGGGLAGTDLPTGAGDLLTLPAGDTRPPATTPPPASGGGTEAGPGPQPAYGGEVTLTLTDWQPIEPGRRSPAPASGPDRTEGLHELARSFAAAAPDQAHDLFANTFGLYGARHVGTTPTPACADLAEASWWHGPTVRQQVATVLPGGSSARARRGRRLAIAPAPAPSAVAGRHRKPEPPAGATLPQGADSRRAAALAAERRAAARMLLAHPLVTATGPHAQAFGLIRRHAGWLTGRFAELLGYPLTVTDSFARLRKAELGAGTLRRLTVHGYPCTPEQYAALTLLLAVLLDGPPRRPAAQLAAQVAQHGAGAPRESDAAGTAVAAAAAAAVAEPDAAPVADADADAVAVGPEAVGAAIALLTEWQVLAPSIPGTAQAPVAAWLSVNHELAAAVVAGCRPPRPQDPPAPRTTVPVAVRRRLVETPAVLLADLTPLEREWLWESRAAEAAMFADFLGLTAEIRCEGIALLDPAGELTDLRFPGPGPLAHVALLLVERLVEELRPLPEEEAPPARQPAPAGVPIAEALIDGILGDLADEYDTEDHGHDPRAAHWRRAHLADRAAFRRDLLDLLHAMGLIAPTAPSVPAGCEPGAARTGWTLLAPAARYAARLELGSEPSTGRHSRR
ncbi:DUF2398 family protein [Kitasatospora sp. NPDC008050]|uniref:DUF2398 family protein n=1 Tax=Kitasatospora sp. NPDC008050 TaxID=3364021 RepID=UPI0036EB5059